ncbi:GNAT family N-acetyltransferase [Haloarcula laminariae]|uniref:GNAT family N-acetyltransferase n=1 Tax=Haloarcula laminariae TaxID=2961577 RepID=UPI0021C8A408|nr:MULTISPECIES: GNAT family N-acetyltransferase [Halomicroarcula]
MTGVREATGRDLPDVMNVLDGAALAVDAGAVGDAIDGGDVLVAVSADRERVLGALVLSGDHVEAVAVRRRRRGQGIGSALVEAAGERRDRLTAEFDADLRPFYEGLGFDIEPAAESGRLWGQRR